MGRRIDHWLIALAYASPAWRWVIIAVLLVVGFTFGHALA